MTKETAPIYLRRVRPEDVRFLWKLANDPDVRAASFSEAQIPMDHHVVWLNKNINDPNCFFFIAYDASGAPVGQVRFNAKGNEALISISLVKDVRGKGYGAALISLSAKTLFETTTIRVIHAYVKLTNTASKAAFLKAGYKDSGTIKVPNCEAAHLTFKREDSAK